MNGTTKTELQTWQDIKIDTFFKSMAPYVHKCLDCGLYFPDEDALLSHVCCFQCPHCNEICNCKSHLETHIQCHVNKEVRICDNCDINSVSQCSADDGFYKQERVSSAICSECEDKYLQQQFSKQRHAGFVVEHTYICDTCGEIFAKHCVFVTQKNFFLRLCDNLHICDFFIRLLHNKYFVWIFFLLALSLSGYLFFLLDFEVNNDN